MVTINCIIPSALKKGKLHYIRKCISSLSKDHPVGIKVNIFIVSENNLVKRSILPKYPHLHILFYPQNKHGFSGMNNYVFHQTMEKYPSDYYLLINDDAWIEPHFFQELKKILKGSFPDVIVPLVRVPDSNECSTFGVEYLRSGFARDATDEYMDTQLFSAACVFLKTNFLKKLHKVYGFYFNPLLSYYLEDVELSIRAVCLRAKIVKDINLKVRHHGSTTSGRKSEFTYFQTFRNLIWLIIMDWPLIYIVRHLLSILAVQLWIIPRAGLKMYFQILLATVKNWQKLISYRRQVVPVFAGGKEFRDVFSIYTWKTIRKKTPIRFP